MFTIFVPLAYMYIQVPWSVSDQAMKETESMWQKQEWILLRDLMSLLEVWQADEGAVGGYIWHYINK